MSRTISQLGYPELEKALDREISKYVRNFYAKDGFVQCYTCGRWQVVASTDCGHFIPRAMRGTRYDLKNLRPQCKRCNWTLEGNHLIFRQKLVAELGEKAVADMELKAGMWGQSRHDKPWMIDEIKKYRAMNKELA